MAEQSSELGKTPRTDENIKIVEAQDEDMLTLFTIASRAFNVNEPFWDAMFPRHLTDQGRVKGGDTFLALRQNRHVRYIKAVDSKGEIAGFARWFVYKDDLDVPIVELKPGPLYENDAELEHAQTMMSDFITTRADYIRQSEGNVVCLDLLAIDPDHQRKGIGGRLVTWGTSLADELKVDAVVESSVFGKGLYQKHGYVFSKYVKLNFPESFADRENTGFAWLVRARSES